MARVEDAANDSVLAPTPVYGDEFRKTACYDLVSLILILPHSGVEFGLTRRSGPKKNGFRGRQKAGRIAAPPWIRDTTPLSFAALDAILEA